MDGHSLFLENVRLFLDYNKVAPLHSFLNEQKPKLIANRSIFGGNTGDRCGGALAIIVPVSHRHGHGSEIQDRCA